LWKGTEADRILKGAETRFRERDRWFGSEFGKWVLTVPPPYGRTHEAVSERSRRLPGQCLYKHCFASNFLTSPIICDMDPVIDNNADELDVQERAAEVRKIRRGLVHQPKKRKLVDEDDSVVLADTTEYEAGISVSFRFLFVSIRLT
jgi:hypothetical protein